MGNEVEAWKVMVVVDGGLSPVMRVDRIHCGYVQDLFRGFRGEVERKKSGREKKTERRDCQLS